MNQINSENANEIIPGLWLGNAKASLDKDFLEKNNIKYIFNCTKDLPFVDNKEYKKFRLPVDDNLQKEEIIRMNKLLPKYIPIIHHALQNHQNVLIHCFAGKQRSACLLTAYLTYASHLPLLTVIQSIKKKRPIAFTPLINFKKSLLDYSKMNGLPLSSKDLQVK